MIRKPQDILAWSLAKVETGRHSVEDSLSAHPEARDELEPLLRLALALEPPDLPAAPAALRRRIRVQLRREAEVAEQPPAWRSTLAGVVRSLVTPFAQPMLRLPKALRMGLCSVAVLAFLTMSVHHAAADSLPGEPLYTVKRWEESMTLSLARSPEEKAQKHLALAQRRLGEAQLLFLNGAESRATATVLEYSENIATGLSYIAVTEEAQGADDQSAGELSEEYREAFETFQMSVTFSPGLWSADTRTILEKSWETLVVSEDDTEGTGEGQEPQTQEQGSSDQDTEEQSLDTQTQTSPTRSDRRDQNAKAQKDTPAQASKPDRDPTVQIADGKAKAQPAQSSKPDRGPTVQSVGAQTKAPPAQASKPDSGPKVQNTNGKAKAPPVQASKPDRGPTVQSVGAQAKAPPVQASKPDRGPKVQSVNAQAKAPPAQASKPDRGPKVQSVNAQAKAPPAQASKPDRGPKVQSADPESRGPKASGGRSKQAPGKQS